jgi:hypothetical protein
VSAGHAAVLLAGLLLWAPLALVSLLLVRRSSIPA